MNLDIWKGLLFGKYSVMKDREPLEQSQSKVSFYTSQATDNRNLTFKIPIGWHLSTG